MAKVVNVKSRKKMEVKDSLSNVISGESFQICVHFV